MYLSKADAALLPTQLGGRPVTPGTAHSGRRLWPLLGPAFVAAVAYVDPGNFATNFSGGAAYGYTLPVGVRSVDRRPGRVLGTADRGDRRRADPAAG